MEKTYGILDVSLMLLGTSANGSPPMIIVTTASLAHYCWIPLILFVMLSSSDPVLRRSNRLLGLQQSEIESREESLSSSSATARKTAAAVIKPKHGQKTKRKELIIASQKKVSAKKQKYTTDDNGADHGATAETTTASSASTASSSSLPRFRETQVLQDEQRTPAIQFVIGIDEAGRGPLAGPVVAAAIYLPTCIPGIIDSKKIINEDTREDLYETIVNSPSVVWAVAVVDAAMIDQINILQATLLGMRVAAAATIQNEPFELPVQDVASTAHKGCYIIRSQQQLPVTSAQHVHALIDGNRLPADMEFCSKECLVKGDGREYAIAAASILAKVTRDRLMREYSQQYPDYMLEQHKGYGTVAHMRAITEHGATPIHRMTFAPMKHMKIDAQIVEEEE
jgi:ribonuclease HII